ncbi:MAG TPA: hypothetical protein PLW68_07590 [Casimicrobiaceae bacterium]|nr:hypothetical protein [Casimicrobiaceae bacterium]
MEPFGPGLGVTTAVQPLLIVVVRLDGADLNSNTSPLNELPANACPDHVKTAQVFVNETETFMVQLHATGLQPAFMTLGMFATQIEPAGTATVWPRLFTVVAGHAT